MLDVVLTLHEPTTLGVADSSGNRNDTLRYLPGSTLRGALAGRWIRSHGVPTAVSPDDRAAFVRLFEGSIRYGPCLGEGTALVPLGVRRCKYMPLPDCAAVAIHQADPGAADAVDCEVCHGPLSFGKGDVIGVDLVARTRVSLQDEVAKEGGLYTTRSLPAGMVMRGRIAGDDPWLRDQTGASVWLGARKSVSGRATIEVVQAEPTAPVPREDGRVLVRFLSPTILVDDATRPLLDVPEEALTQLLGVACRIIRSWVRPIEVAGWHLASGLAKPTELALAAGSEVLFQPLGGVGPTGLARLEQEGLGLRRAEGFGWVQVNPPVWRPPMVKAPVEVALVTAWPVAVTHRAWLLGPLKGFGDELENGRPRDVAARQILGLPRVNELLDTERDALRGMLQRISLDNLVILIDQLEARNR